jgi:hypothetical protein
MLAALGGAETTATEAICLPIPDDPGSLACHYDLTISHPAHNTPAFQAFDAWLAQAAGRRGLSCALIHEGIVEETIRRLQQGPLTIGFHLDYFALWHVPGEANARLSQAVQDAGGRPINAPARSRLFTDKAACHAELVRRGLGVPHTLILRPGSPDRPLRAGERTRLHLDEPGARVYVKPANGFGGRGVACLEAADAEKLDLGIAAARSYNRGEAYLVQREVISPLLVCDDGVARPAYWRILYCLGQWLPFWWNRHEPEHGRPSYRRVTEAERKRHHLEPVLDFSAELAALSGLEWFSTELCLSDGGEPSRYRVPCCDGRWRPVVAIDYLNDQCDVDVQSRWLGAPPEGLVRQVAELFVAAAWQCRLSRGESGLDTMGQLGILRPLWLDIPGHNANGRKGADRAPRIRGGRAGEPVPGLAGQGSAPIFELQSDRLEQSYLYPD